MRAHGEFEIIRHGRVTLTRLKSAWNEQGLLNYRQHYTPVVEQLLAENATAPWGKLLDLTEWETSPMDLIGPYEQFQKRCVERGCVAVAFVARLQVHRFMIENADFSCATYIANDEQDALRWLGEQGISLD
jgi:hypothetical protein